MYFIYMGETSTELRSMTAVFGKCYPKKVRNELT